MVSLVVQWSLISALALLPAQALTGRLTVFAASDLGPPLADLVPPFERRHQVKVTVVLGSTGNLAHQIRHGAPADVFFAASASSIESLASAGAVRLATRAVYARGRLVTVTLAGSGVAARDLQDLVTPDVKRIAMANPAHAPYGQAAQQALESAGLWKSLQPRLVYGDNVQQAVQFVRSGSADAGIIARSVADTPDLRWSLIDDSLHRPIEQVAAVVSHAKEPRLAQAFVDFIKAVDGRSVLKRCGFLLPGEF